VAIPGSGLGPVWAPGGNNGSDYFWVSFADTGTDCATAPGGVCVPNSSGVNGPPSAIFLKTFDLPGNDNVGSLTVWADDTARVFLDGTMIFDANPVTDGNCADGPIGCRIGDGETFNFSSSGIVLGAGTHTLEFDVFQLANGPFGLLFEGSIVSSTSTPEPASYLLLALGLLGVALLAPRLKRT
jgi:PEP-CTERM motif